ncbi:MAG: hypothetical protein HY880_05125, partial [Deltaproteobacteria bacterium]|nr:hypothetical protein [Deltaproteobacteria bacterium]
MKETARIIESLEEISRLSTLQEGFLKDGRLADALLLQQERDALVASM